MKKVFLEELPKSKNGKLIDWINCLGYKVKFIYKDIEDYVEIIDYYISDNGKPYLIIKYKERIKPISTDSLKKGSLGNILMKNTSDFKYEIGTTFKDDKRDITIIDRKYMKQNRNDKKYEKRKWYKYHCNKCYINEDWIEETTLSKGIGCNACCVPSKKVLLGVNTIYDKATWMIKLGVSEEDAKKYSFRSTNEIEVTCPHCGRPKITTPDKIYSHKSIGCNCGDNISYPNKYKHEFYNQLLIQGQIKNYIPEYKIKNRNYDMFIELNNGETLIDENHGEQHGKFIKSGNITIVKYIRKCFNINNKRDEIKNDSYKCWLAYENGIDNYIQSDCFISDSDYMKHNIENSILSKMFDLSNIDWNKCEEYALKNITKEICDYWHEHREVNKEYITTTDLIDIFKFDRSTIIKYLKKGNKIGWCSYDPKEEQRLGAMRSNALKRNKVLVYDLNMNYITEGESASWLSRNSVKKLGVKISQSKISEVSTGKRSSYKGFIFKYAITIDK